MTTPAPEPATERWTYGGIRADKDGKRWHAWVAPAGEEHWFARTGGSRMAVGSDYTAQVTRREGGPSPCPDPDRDLARRAGCRPPQRPGRGDRPLLELAAPLRTSAQRGALAACVLRKLNSAWNTRKPPDRRQ